MPKYIVEDLLGDTGCHEVADPIAGEKLILELFHKQFPAHKETGHEVDIGYANAYYCLLKEIPDKDSYDCACKELPGRCHEHLTGFGITIAPYNIKQTVML